MTFDFTRRNFLATSAAAATLPMLGSRASAQGAWPNKPIRLVRMTRSKLCQGQLEHDIRERAAHGRSPTPRQFLVRQR